MSDSTMILRICSTCRRIPRRSSNKLNNTLRQLHHLHTNFIWFLTMALKNDKPTKGKPDPKQNRKVKTKDSKYVHGVTKIDRTKACPIPKTSNGQEQVLEPSLLIGQKKCRHCYNKNPQPCDCGQDLYETDVSVFWTKSSGYRKLAIPVVRKCEDIAMLEAKRLGMSCVVIRKEQHNTYTQRDYTGRKTGMHPAADWHITLYLGDAVDKLLLAGHLYVFMNGKNQPQCKLNAGNRTALEPHEQLEGLTLKDATPEVYWGINGSCGWDFI